MTRTHNHRLSAAIVGVALGTGAPASARPFDVNSAGSYVPAPETASSAPQTTAHPASGSSLDWEYAAIGSGVAAVAVTGVGGTLVAARRRQRRISTQRSTIAA